MPAVFIAQSTLAGWADAGQVRLDDTTLWLLAENRSVQLKPAVRFVTVIDGGVDPHKLLGKVKSREQLDELGAEHYLDSVILGDVGYQVVEGFLGDLAAAAAAPAPAAAPAVEPTPVEDDAQLLSRLFLDTVR